VQAPDREQLTTALFVALSAAFVAFSIQRAGFHGVWPLHMAYSQPISESLQDAAAVFLVTLLAMVVLLVVRPRDED
jgi:hypothetical protein